MLAYQAILDRTTVVKKSKLDSSPNKRRRHSSIQLSSHQSRMYFKLSYLALHSLYATQESEFKVS